MTDGITPTGEELADGPWNPGISSRLPARARPLATVFASANCTIPLSLIDERSDFTGIPPEDLAIFRPSRLALHELLIRVTGSHLFYQWIIFAKSGS